MWPVATVFGSTDTEHSYHQRKSQGQHWEGGKDGLGEREWGRAAKGWSRGCLCGNMYGAESLDEGGRVGGGEEAA